MRNVCTAIYVYNFEAHVTYTQHFTRITTYRFKVPGACVKCIFDI